MAAELRIAIDDIPLGGMKEVKDGDAKALFVRDNDGVRAFQATCPHYGAPLAKGAICDRTLYCPWHKAAFDIGSGDLREPPALDGLDRYPVRLEGSVAIATLEAERRPDPARRGGDGHFVIVGTGAAGVAAAITLRREGFGGRLTMVGREPGQPYDRPKLSKNFLAKKTPAAAMALEDDFFGQLDIAVQTAAATRIEPDQRRVTLDDGTAIVADALLIAIGSRAARPPIDGADHSRVRVLRSLDDAVAISEAADGARSLVCIGSGFIGVEAAAFLTKRGLKATIVSPESVPYAKRFGVEVGEALKAHHEKNGLTFLQGSVKRIDGEDGAVVHLEDGRSLKADLVLLGTGAKPETDVIAVRKRDDGGIEAPADLQIAPRVWIAGDIAAFPDSRSGETVRIEHWRLAEQHGIHAAKAMLGHEGPFTAAPFFWSNQGDKRLDYAGHAEDWDAIVTNGDPASLDFISYYVKGDEARAACAIGRGEQMIAFLHELDSGRPVARQNVPLP